MSIGPARAMNWPMDPVDPQADPKEDLRGVHWKLSYVGTQVAQTETKLSYIKHGTYRKQAKVENGDDLKASHIDLSVGQSRSGKHWQSAQTAEMSRNTVAKYACGKPQGFEQLGEELRKSSVSFSERPSMGNFQTQQKASYQTPPHVQQAASFADTVGKDLRSSHIDIANGKDKSTAQWKAMQTSEMDEYAREKFDCKKPAGFDHLIAELRKSSVPLGGRQF
eukprot:CAMPEP_0197651402 /NCGR_PEP_ID=MMETSP1338-20131121/32324_1 /TAXON_ID=43686 ORGANISM="Pelagodinium beii, Strain RCC1491" /NCGR_SAMPLE_ID=MMETSP1338 /ASSEMBLY_ACC=CAM_ASM_000754 /LENGTH=221 /DNA_ID=CAMNT_0043226025 /DNA_START=47 /DNA_END=712 /DNA_ORIENTATION=-